jgi:hypothetical protein
MTVRMPALFFLLSFAAAAQIPAEPPKVLRLVREIIKPGRAAAHEKLGTVLAHTMARGKYPVNFLALTALTGDEETWTLESHDSFASVENADTFIEKAPALKWSLSQYEAQDGELISAGRRLLAAYRKDLSYHGEQLAQTLPKMRYMSVVMVRLHPSRDAEFSEAVRTVSAAYEKSNSDQPLVIYQVVSGAQSPTFLFFTSMASLNAMDDAGRRGKTLRDALGEAGAAAVLKTSAEVTASSESFLFAFNPRASYVSKDFAAADVDFWTPKPPPKPAAPPLSANPGAAPPPPHP